MSTGAHKHMLTWACTTHTRRQAASASASMHMHMGMCRICYDLPPRRLGLCLALLAVYVHSLLEGTVGRSVTPGGLVACIH